MGRIELWASRLRRAGREAQRALAREWSRTKSRLGPPKVRLVFDPRYRVPDNELADPARGQKILDHLDARGWLSPANVLAPPPLTMRQLLRVHDRSYLEGLDDPRGVGAVFGGMTFSAERSAAFLVAQRWATSGTVHAARVAVGLSSGRGAPLERRSPRQPRAPHGPIVNLGGGLHHAHPARGAGFCAFNDVAVAIAELRDGGFTGRVLVVDLDMHHGDGTRAFFANDDDVHTFSMHASSWDTSPARSALDVELGPAVGDETYLATLKRTLPAFFSHAAPQLVFYVAGVDVAHDDRLGGYRLSAEGIAERDRYVFELAGGLPTVMVLAGGYGPEAWRYTARTLLRLLSGEDRPIPTRDEIALMRFRRIRSGLTGGKLSVSGDTPVPEASFDLTEEDLYGDIFGRDRDPKLLGFYSVYGLELAFERYGLGDQLRKRGYRDFELAMDASPTSGQGLRIYADATRKDILVELVVTDFYGVAPYKLLSIEWLLLQDPRAKPKPGEVLLPGQQHPGLGALDIVVGMLVMACERLTFDGLTFVPAHFHLAARARRILKVLDPEDEALFLALASATGSLGVFEATRRIEHGDVVDEQTGETVQYRPMRMVLPVSKELQARLLGPDYARGVEEAARKLTLSLRDGAETTSPSPSVAPPRPPSR